MDQPMRFSIVVPAYNEADYLANTLSSLQSQDFRGPYEVIVVDNNSTDDTAKVAERFGVRVLRETRQGVCAARQRGAEAASGEILISADADTVYPPQWLTSLDRLFRTSPAVAVAGPCRYENPSWWARAYPALLFGVVAQVAAHTGFVLYVSATNLAVRRAEFPGYDARLTQGGDELDLLRRLRRRGPVLWDADNVVLTSARRLRRGLLYNLVVSMLLYYLLGYLLNRLFRRQAVGMAPALRPRPDSAPALRPRPGSAPALRPPPGSTPPRRLLRRRLLGLALIVVLTVAALASGIGSAAVTALTSFWAVP